MSYTDCRLDHCSCINLSRINHTLHFRKPKKKNTSKTITAQAYQSRCCFWRSSLVFENRLRLFNPLTPQERATMKTMPSEIGFPMTLTSGAFVNKKRHKQTSHELQNNLDSSCISFCTSSRKRQFKTSQDDTKLSQLQLSGGKFPDAAYIFCMNSPVKFWPIRT